MADATYELRVKSGGWTHHPDTWDDPNARLVSFTLKATRNGSPLGGDNVQAHVNAPDQPEYNDVFFELSSGWRVSLRNQFERRPEVARAVFEVVDAELSRFTEALASARATQMVELQRELWATPFAATVADHEPR